MNLFTGCKLINEILCFIVLFYFHRFHSHSLTTHSVSKLSVSKQHTNVHIRLIYRRSHNTDKSILRRSVHLHVPRVTVLTTLIRFLSRRSVHLHAPRVTAVLTTLIRLYHGGQFTYMYPGLPSFSQH